MNHSPHCRRVCVRALLARVTVVWISAVTGCVAPQPDNQPDGDGRFGLVVTNRSEMLVFALLAVTTELDEVQTLAIPVAPMSWDSVILGCDVDEVVPVGMLVSNILDGSDSIELGLDELPFTRGLDFDCGSVITFEIEPSPVENPNRPVTASVRTLRDGGSGSGDGPPGDASGLVLVEINTAARADFRLELSWAASDDRVFQSSLNVSADRTQFAFLLPCPVNRFALGSLADPRLSAGEVLESGAAIDPPPPLDEDQLPCGSVVNIRVERSTASASGYLAELTSTIPRPDQSDDLFTGVHDFLVDGDIFDHPSNLLSLLPPSVVTDGEP
ncbi:MAG: hypothetical protein HOP29_18465 [Phycisphaerales bacterium]|nr:hypothetical protein [Phycisphaerales bacterium]